jgi:ABC-type uncharacterized transport system permease subunit
MAWEKVMKTTGRLFIAAVALLTGGLWTLLSYCNGATSFNFGWPADGSKLSVNITTIGTAVWVGLPLILVGVIVLAIAFVAAIVIQFMPTHRHDYEETESVRLIPLDE